MNKSIVIISPFLVIERRGIERFNFALVDKLRSRGFDVTVYCLGSNVFNFDKIKIEGVKIRYVPNTRYFRFFVAAVFYRLWLISDSPDKIVLNFLYHGEQFLPRKLNYLYVLNSPASQVLGRYRFIEKNIKRFPNLTFVAVSKMVKEEAIPYIGGRQISVINNGVDTEKFRLGDGRNSSKCIRLVCVAALEERKGIDYLVNAVSKSTKSVYLDIFGAGEKKESLLDLIKDRGMRERIKIFAPVDNLETLLPSYDVFCLLSEGEAFALSPIEALSCGLPVLLNKARPFDELECGPYGLMINRESESEFAQSIEHLKAVGSSNQAKVRSYALKYDWNNIADEYAILL